MTYTEIFILLFCATVFPYIIMGLVAIISIYMPAPLFKHKINLSREALKLEIQNLNERCEELLLENTILMRENHRLRRFENNGYQIRNVSTKHN